MLLIEMLLVGLFVFKLLLVGLLVRLLVDLLFRLLIIRLLLVGLLVLRFLHITLLFFVGVDEDDGTRVFPLAALPGQGPPCPGPDISASPSSSRPGGSTALRLTVRHRPGRAHRHHACVPRNLSSASGGVAFRLRLMVHVVDVMFYNVSYAWRRR